MVRRYPTLLKPWRLAAGFLSCAPTTIIRDDNHPDDNFPGDNLLDDNLLDDNLFVDILPISLSAQFAQFIARIAA